MAKRVYSFGGGYAEGSADMKNLLGGKGAGLAEMSNLGVPVPAGFTITTEVCTEYYNNVREFPAGLDKDVEAAMKKVEKITVYFKYSFYGFDYWGYKTIKDLIDSEGIKRGQVNSFYKHYSV